MTKNEQEACDRQTYKWLAHDVKMMQGMENFLSLAERLEEEETEPNKKLLNDLEDWTMYCWESWGLFTETYERVRRKISELGGNRCLNN